jgi:DNA-binding NarL/FixJ family response regulator
MSSSIRVLVVDDYELFRRFVCSTLRKRQGLQVVGEAAGGLEAVRIAEKLQPDMILLDIGLPDLNGLEVANRIRQVASGARILFLTNNMDKDIVRAALSTGARGYVLKADAGRELLPAVETVLGGDDFLSSGITAVDSDEIDNNTSSHSNSTRISWQTKPQPDRFLPVLVIRSREL